VRTADRTDNDVPLRRRNVDNLVSDARPIPRWQVARTHNETLRRRIGCDLATEGHRLRVAASNDGVDLGTVRQPKPNATTAK
jgi:hypothetical protein